MSKNVVIYDVEVKYGPDEVKGRWENPEAMGFGIMILYIPHLDRYKFYDLGGQWRAQSILEKADLRVGFNSIRFDNRVIFGNDYSVSPFLGRENDLDLLLGVVKAKFNASSISDAISKVGAPVVFDKSLNLDSVSEKTLGRRKTGHGADAPFLIRDEKWAEVYEYCLHDVIITNRLLWFMMKYEYVIDGNGRQIKVDMVDKEVGFVSELTLWLREISDYLKEVGG